MFTDAFYSRFYEFNDDRKKNHNLITAEALFNIFRHVFFAFSVLSWLLL